MACVHEIEDGARKREISRGWFRSIDLWVMGPARSHCATLLDYIYQRIIKCKRELLNTDASSSPKKDGVRKRENSRGWFRSIDLWVMGPARSHCATLLDYIYQRIIKCKRELLNTDASSSQKKTVRGKEKIAEDGFDPSTSGLWAQHAPTAPLCLTTSTNVLSNAYS